MSESIYFICALTSAFCAFLLLRGYRRRPNAVLFWASLYFLCQTATNVLLVIDLVFLPNVDMSMLRRFVTMIGTALFLLGLIWEADR